MTHKVLTRKKIRTQQIPKRKIVDPRNTHEKKFGPENYPGKKNWNPQNTHEKKLWTNEIPTRKIFGSTKYPRMHDDSMTLNPQDPRWPMSHKI